MVSIEISPTNPAISAPVFFNCVFKLKLHVFLGDFSSEILKKEKKVSGLVLSLSEPVNLESIKVSSKLYKDLVETRLEFFFFFFFLIFILFFFASNLKPVHCNQIALMWILRRWSGHGIYA